MKKILILSPLLLSLFAGSSLAAGMDCIANWERDHSLNYLECTAAPAPEKESGQTPAPQPGISGTSIATSPAASQNVLCSQCHQSAATISKLAGSTLPPRQNTYAAFH